LHYGVIDIGPHDLPLGKRWRPLQPGALEGHHCRATRAVAHDEIGLEIEWFRGEAGPYYRRSWKLIFVGQIRGGVRLGAPMRGDAATGSCLFAMPSSLTLRSTIDGETGAF